jgi:hypothetical protein
MGERAVISAYRFGGLKGLISHLAIRTFGEAHMLNLASSVNYRNAGMKCTREELEFLERLLPNFNHEQINEALKHAKSLPELNDKNSIALTHPERWNAGKGLQYIIASLVLLLRPTLVVETGTANGSSALAISSAMNSVGSGKLLSIDIKLCDAPLVPTNLRKYIEFVQLGGSKKGLQDLLETRFSAATFKSSMFLHDSDHSYIGQINEYKIARKLGFSVLISDDVDTSLAFTDFAGENGVVMYDSPKFIGGLVL